MAGGTEREKVGTLTPPNNADIQEIDNLFHDCRLLGQLGGGEVAWQLHLYIEHSV